MADCSKKQITLGAKGDTLDELDGFRWTDAEVAIDAQTTLADHGLMIQAALNFITSSAETATPLDTQL